MAQSGFSFLESTISDLQKALLNREVSSVDTVEWYIDRIEKYDKSGLAINAVVNVSEQAWQEAAELDAYLQENGKLKGPLHGIPVLVKDQAETVGIPTTFGCKAFETYIPETDATVVKQLREAGAIILAKTSMCDFAAGWFSFSSVTGKTKSPYALNRDAGGSSAGTAAGIAANLGMIGIGEDTGGSIRIPSSFNNLFGLRVTTGLISRFGFSPLVHFQDTPGPITRTVEDMAKLLDVIVEYDPEDVFTSAVLQSKDAGCFETLLKDASLKGVRIGILREAFGPDDSESGPVNKVVEASIENLKQAGAEIVDAVEIPNLKEYLSLTSLYSTQSKFDITNFLEKRPNSPLKSFMEVYETKSFHPLNDLFDDVAEGPDIPEEEQSYYRQRLAQEEFRRSIENCLALNNIDVILFPDVQIIPPAYDDLKAGKWSCFTFPTNTVIASQSGLPAISIPGGLTEAGIPVGFELLGRRFSEGLLIQCAHVYEKQAHPRRLPNLETADVSISS